MLDKCDLFSFGWLAASEISYDYSEHVTYIFVWLKLYSFFANKVKLKPKMDSDNLVSPTFHCDFGSVEPIGFRTRNNWCKLNWYRCKWRKIAEHTNGHLLHDNEIINPINKWRHTNALYRVICNYSPSINNTKTRPRKPVRSNRNNELCCTWTKLSVKLMSHMQDGAKLVVREKHLWPKTSTNLVRCNNA